MIDSVNARVRELRERLGMTQTEFGRKLSLNRGIINNYEQGVTKVRESIIDLICIVYNVNREWLINGIGDMFPPEQEDDRYFNAIGSITNDEPDSFRKRFVIALGELDESGLDVLESFIRSLTGENKKSGE